MSKKFDAYDDPNAIARALEKAGVESMPIHMDYDDCFRMIQKMTSEQISKLRAESPEATADELRGITIGAMREILAIPSCESGDWLLKRSEKGSVPRMTLFFSAMLSMFHNSFGVDTTDLVVQESLMGEVQKSLAECFS